MNARMLITAAAFALLPAPSFAQGNNCTLSSVSVPGGQVTADYDPSESQETRAEFALSVISSGCGNRNVPLRLEADPSNPGAMSGGTIRLTSGSNVLEAAITDSERGRPNNGAIVIDLAANGTSSQALYLVLAAGQQVPPGVYRARLLADVLPSVGGSGRDAGVTTAFDVIVTVSPLIGLAAATGTGLDLGEIRAGGSALSPVTFRAYANINYKLKLTTDYQLQLRKSPTETDPNVPYVILFNNQSLTANGAQIAFDKPDSTGFRTHSLDVQVPALALRPAGTYRDYITVEISANVSGG